MPDPIDPGQGGAPAPAASPAPASPAPAATASPPAATPPAAPVPQNVAQTEPAYIANVRKETRRRVLKELGLKIGKDDDADKAVDDLKSKIVGRKEENRLLREALLGFQDEKAQLEAKATSYEQAVASLLETEIALIPAEKRDAVKAALQGDADGKLKQLAALKALGAQFGASAPAPAAPQVAPAPGAQPPAVQPPAATPPAPIPAPTSSAPPQPGPAPTSPPSPTDVRTQFKQLKASNNKTDRMRAAILALQNSELLLPDDIA